MKAKIAEIFKTIQGEGLYQGIPQLFIRFFGCNLKCTFCDTKLEYYKEKSLEDLLQELKLYGSCHSISLTGGEPLLQIDFLKKLLPALKEKEEIIYLESNGTLYKYLEEIIGCIDIIAMDFKLSSSTGLKDFWFAHREFLKVANSKKKEVFIKALIGKKTLIDDVRIATAIIKEIRQDIPFILQPENPYENLLEDKLKYFEKICKNANINVTVVPQLHKTLGIR